ncbi:hypothetical protein BU14_0293s0028 [Porphyra umbilicalis]|uniref:EF-hand domain-containing protein n=1 Tax=Porphyra umbilicalis TaxID=2786 RepID=A0A1X6P0Q8_PORUM|nr:hypothetical protein BU14_0293s0028 [Porphyra umbilicalis]|eukprot:OSX74356.1 hypothetical protein BU14_0293s0028 [Porphyra umbilicalis]
MGFHFPDLRELLAPPLPGRRFTDSKAFAKFVSAAFNKVAVGGVVDDFALVVAMCELHFKVRRRMPGVTRVPTRDAVREVLAEFDTNRDGVLDEEEFKLFAQQWWNEAGAGWLYRAAIVSAVTCVAIPELAAAARRHTPGGGEVPKGLWVAAAGLLFKLASTAIAARMERVDA